MPEIKNLPIDLAAFRNSPRGARRIEPIKKASSPASIGAGLTCLTTVERFFRRGRVILPPVEGMNEEELRDAAEVTTTLALAEAGMFTEFPESSPDYPGDEGA